MAQLNILKTYSSCQFLEHGFLKKKKIFLFWTNRIKLLRKFFVVLTSTIYANEMLISVIVT